MPDMVEVSADDVRAVAGVFTGLAAHPYLAAVVGLSPAQDAVSRMLAAVEMAELPADPVPGPAQGAIAHHELMTTYENAGFSHEEAFAVTMAYIQAAATGFMLRGGPHG